MRSQEYLLLKDSPEAAQLIPFKRRELVVKQMADGESASHYVIVPGFKVGGPHTSNSKRFGHLQALDVEPVGNTNRKAIENVLRRRGFRGPINFW